MRWNSIDAGRTGRPSSCGVREQTLRLPEFGLACRVGDLYRDVRL